MQSEYFKSKALQVKGSHVVCDRDDFRLTYEDLYHAFVMRHGDLQKTGWAPRQNLKFGYFKPSNYYDAMVNKILKQGDTWLDVGGGSQIFSGNASLEQELVHRASWVVAVDPSENVKKNSSVNERVQCLIEGYNPDRLFDLITCRMVVEHIAHPVEMIDSISRLLDPNGYVVVFTVKSTSPSSIVSRITPNKLHYPIKWLLFGGEEEDTFPTLYKMNTQKTLRQLFDHGGLEERFFAYLDDCSTSGEFRILNYIELSAWLLFSHAGFRYPETNLLGVYAKKKNPSKTCQ